MKKLLIILLIAHTTSLFAQGKKEIKKTIEKNLPSFTAIEVGENFSIDVKNGSASAIQIETIEGCEDFVKIEVESGVLKINSDKRIRQPKLLKLTIISPQVNSVNLAGAAEMTTSDTLRAESFEIKLAGAANAKIVLAVENFKSEISGAGNLIASGFATNHVSVITGAGDLKSFGLESQIVNLNVSGAGDAQVNAVKELQVKASGAGDVIYLNDPENLIAEVSGAGEVRKKSTSSVEQSSDTTRLRFGDVKVIIIDESKTKEGKKESEKDLSSEKPTKKKKHQKIGHWAGLDLGLNAFMTYDNSFTMAPFNQHLELDVLRSTYLSFNFAQWELPIVKNHLSIVSGLGLEWQKYAFKNNTTMLPDKNQHIGFIDTLTFYNKSLFKTSWINAPLLIAFNSNKKEEKAFHIAAGVVIGYNYTQKTKTHYSLGGNEFKNKTRGDYALEPFKYAATVRAGYGKFNAFATYQLNQLFKKGAGPELFPVTAGITLIGF